MFDKRKEECGVFGIYRSEADTIDVARSVYYGLYALQHRGEESCGIAVTDDGTILLHKGLGQVQEVFDEVILNHLKGKIAIGHVRYSTAGSNNAQNAQPLVSKYVKGTISLAHNGNLTNSNELRHELEMSGAIFQSTNDSEVIAYVIARQRLDSHSIEEAIVKSMKIIKGAYSMVLMSPRKLIAVRDPNGFRPLAMGKIGNSYVFASESCAFDAMGAKFIRDIEPGEVVVVTEDGVKSLKDNCRGVNNMCIFEYVYFARPDSVIEGTSVHEARQMAGRFLARQKPVEADVVIGVPDSGLDAALGYSYESGIPYGIGFIKNKYVGRSFILPTQGERETAVKIKLNAISSTVRDKRVVLIDDSIVRGTTSARIVSLLREAGAREVHMRASSPPFTNPCYFGTDIDSKENLIACKYTMDEIAEHIGVDTLDFLSVENLRKIAVCATGECQFCEGCFTGKYPVEPPKGEYSKFSLKF